MTPKLQKIFKVAEEVARSVCSKSMFADVRHTEISVDKKGHEAVYQTFMLFDKNGKFICVFTYGYFCGHPADKSINGDRGLYKEVNINEHIFNIENLSMAIEYILFTSQEDASNDGIF